MEGPAVGRSCAQRQGHLCREECGHDDSRAGRAEDGRPRATLGKGARVPETHNVGETGDLARGASKDVTIALAPGHYSLVCNLPGHYSDGMHTDFTCSRGAPRASPLSPKPWPALLRRSGSAG